MRISPFASQLLLETNGNEASDFISTYVLSLPGLFICLSMIVLAVVLIYAEKRYAKCAWRKLSNSYYIALFFMAFMIYMGIRSRRYTAKFVQLLLFDLAGIKSPFYKETKSVINERYQPRPKRFFTMGEEVYEEIMRK